LSGIDVINNLEIIKWEMYMQIVESEILHRNAGWRDFSFLKLKTDEGITGISEFNECYGSPGWGAQLNEDVIAEHPSKFVLES
jgi:hypothetical protein